MTLTRRTTTLGADTRCDLALDSGPEGEVADRHAVILQDRSAWIIRDLGSGRGTWLNDSPVSREKQLVPGDIIRLGTRGPRFRFEFATTDPAGPSMKRGSRHRLLSGGALALLIAVLGWAVWRASRSESDDARTIATLHARLDSLTDRLRDTRARESALADRLAATLASVESARAELLAGARPEQLAPVVDSLARRQSTLVSAAEFDLPAIAAATRGAVALLLAEPGDRGAISGTAVVIARAGDTSWVVTSRHLVIDSDGRPARRLGLMFDGTAQLFEALLLRSDPDHDLSLLRVAIRGGTPVIHGLAPDPPLGAPLAVMTFPLGLDAAGSQWRRQGISASAFTATLVQSGEDRLVLEGYGTQGMSGSPVLTAEGDLAGLVYGGIAGSEGRLVLAVPARAVRRLLEAEGIRPG